MKKKFTLTLLALGLLLGSCARGSKDARLACEAAEKGEVEQALEYADKAYADRADLGNDDLCRLAASYAVVAVTLGNEDAAIRFQDCYKESLERDPKGAEAFYNKLDPQMADGLAIISGLLDGQANYTTMPESAADTPDSPGVIDDEALAED